MVHRYRRRVRWIVFVLGSSAALMIAALPAQIVRGAQRDACTSLTLIATNSDPASSAYHVPGVVFDVRGSDGSQAQATTNGGGIAVVPVDPQGVQYTLTPSAMPGFVPVESSRSWAYSPSDPLCSVEFLFRVDRATLDPALLTPAPTLPATSVESTMRQRLLIGLMLLVLGAVTALLSEQVA